MKKLLLVLALLSMTLSLVARPPGRTWSGVPRTTLAERIATKYDPQGGTGYSTGRGYRKIPRHYPYHYRRRYRRRPSARGGTYRNRRRYRRRPWRYDDSYRYTDATRIEAEHIGIE